MRAGEGLAMAVMMALAVGHIRAGRPECMGSLVSGREARTGWCLCSDSVKQSKRRSAPEGLLRLLVDEEW